MVLCSPGEFSSSLLALDDLYGWPDHQKDVDNAFLIFTLQFWHSVYSEHVLILAAAIPNSRCFASREDSPVFLSWRNYLPSSGKFF